MLRTFSLALVMLLSLAGLSACGGGGADVNNKAYSTTLGQELADLNKAKANGELSQDEFEAARKSILERYED